MRRRQLSPCLGAGLLLLSGCAYSTSAIAPAQLSASVGAPEAIVLRGAEAEHVTLQRASELRFQRLDGSFTPWFSAGEVFVNDEGVLVAHAVPLALASRARVHGLGRGAASLLAYTAPPDAALNEVAPGTFELGVSGEAIAGWLDRFILATARISTPREEKLRIPPACFGAGATGPGCGDDAAAQNERSLRYLGERLAGAPLGHWSFDILSRTVGPLDGAALFSARDAGPRVSDGLRWADMRLVEVKNVSPGKTAASIVAQITVGVALGAVLGIALAAAPAFAGGHESAGAAAAVSTTVSAIHTGGGGDSPRPVDPTLWRAGLTPPAPERMRPLLRGGESR